MEAGHATSKVRGLVHGLTSESLTGKRGPESG